MSRMIPHIYYHDGSSSHSNFIQVREVVGSIKGRVIPNTLKMVLIASLLGAQGCGVSIATDWLVIVYMEQWY